MNTAQWLQKAQAYLASRGVSEVQANAEFIMAEALKTGRAQLALHASRVPTTKQSNHFWHLIEQRAKRVPLAYVLGSQPFMGLDIKVTGEALIPRPETEELVSHAVALLKQRENMALHILEIGTGTGCIAIALSMLLPQSTVYATDISPSALRLAMENGTRHHRLRQLRFIQEDLFKDDVALKGWADLVISNPPYIPTGELKNLEPEVLKEPFLALDGGKDGLSAIRAIVPAAAKYLKPSGWLVLEIGSDQAAAVKALLAAAGFSDTSVSKDMQGLDRIAAGRLS